LKVQVNRRRIILALILAFLGWIIGGFFWAVQKERNQTWVSFALHKGNHQLFFSLPEGTYIAHFSDDLSAGVNMGAHEVGGLNSEISIRNTVTGNVLIEHSPEHSVRFNISDSGHIRDHQVDIDLRFFNRQMQYVYLKIQRL